MVNFNFNGMMEVSSQDDREQESSSSPNSSTSSSFGRGRGNGHGPLSPLPPPVIREWTPLTSFLSKIPQKAQKGLVSLDLRLTCVAATAEYLAVGTNVGLVYWYNRRTEKLDRLKTENTSCAISTISVVSTVDFMLAAGNEEGLLTIFQIPKISLPEKGSLKGLNKLGFADSSGAAASIQRYDVYGLHRSKITALEWSTNGMKLFSGDVAGCVFLTELHFESETVQSRPLFEQPHEIVQLSYSKHFLLICTTMLSIIYSLDTKDFAKVGSQDRKVQGKFGGIFRHKKYIPHDGAKLYSVRPGGRLWVADTSGSVEHTIKFKDLLLNDKDYSPIPVINPNCGLPSDHKDFQIGTLQLFLTSYLLTWSKHLLYVLDPVTTRVLFVCSELSDILSASVNQDTNEIFILQSDRILTRLSAEPDPFYSSSQSGSINSNADIFISKFGSININDIRKDVDFFTSRIVKETSKFVSKNPAGTIISTLKQVIEADGDVQDGQRWQENGEEAFEEGRVPVPDIEPTDKFEHISQQPFDEVLLVPPPPTKKRRRRPKTQLKGDGKLADSVSLSSSTYSVNSDEERKLVQPHSMSQSWCAGDPQAQDLESKEEILARKLNWPELLPESKKSQWFPMERLELDPTPTDSTEVTEATAKTVELEAVEPEAPEVVDERLEQSEEVDQLEHVEEDSTYQDIYTKYAKREGDGSPSILSFGPPSSVSSNNPTNISGFGLVPPDIVEIHEEDPDLLKTLLPVRDMIVDPVSPVGNEHWTSYTTPAALICVASCDKFVLCCDRKYRVYVSVVAKSGPLRWVQTNFLASWISVSACGSVIWRVCPKGILYSLPNPDLTAMEGDQQLTWSKILSNVVSVSVQMHVGWVVKSDGSLLICTGLLSTAVVPDFQRVQVPSPVARVVSCPTKRKLWILTTDGRLYFRDGVSDSNLIGKRWMLKPLDLAVTSLALGPSSTLWLGDNCNNVYFLEGVSEPFYEGKPYHWKVKVSLATSGFESESPPSSSSFSLSSIKNKLSDSMLPKSKKSPVLAGTESFLWLSLAGSKELFLNQTEVEGSRWAPYKARKIAKSSTWTEIFGGSIYGEHGFLWALDQKGKLFYIQDFEAKAIDLPCSSPIACVVLAPDALWLLNEKGEIFSRDEISQRNPLGHGWGQIELSCKEKFVFVSLGSDVAWACDVRGNVFMRVGSVKPRSSVNDISPAWVPVDDGDGTRIKFTKVYVGTTATGSMVWALDDKQNIYVREAVVPELPIGVAWLLVSGIEATRLTLSETAVWALSPKGEIFRRCGISNHNFIGDYWKKIPGPRQDEPVQVLTASLSDDIWALDSSSEIMKHSYRTLSFHDTFAKRKVELDPEDKDWELVESLDL